MLSERKEIMEKKVKNQKNENEKNGLNVEKFEKEMKKDVVYN